MSKLFRTALFGAAIALAPMLVQAQSQPAATPYSDAQYKAEMAQCKATQESCQAACPELRSHTVRYPEPECATACWDVRGECEKKATEARDKRAAAAAANRAKITVKETPAEAAEGDKKTEEGEGATPQ